MTEARMLPLSLIVVLLVAHFVADFICQSDWMAQHKARRVDALALHVVVYSAVLFVFVNWCQWIRFGYPVPFPMAALDGMALFLCANFAAHFVQDAITSRITSRLWFVEARMFFEPPRGAYLSFDARKRHWFFVAIGADQLLHAVTLFITASWWLA